MAKICSPRKGRPGEAATTMVGAPSPLEKDWKIHIIFLDPRSAGNTTIKKNSRTALFLDKTKNFYRSCFTQERIADEHCMDYCVEHMPSFIIMANKKESARKRQAGGSLLAVSTASVVAAITFDLHIQKPKSGRPHKELRSDGAIYVSWLSVANTDVHAPVSLSIWRRNGFGTFMLILATKYSLLQVPWDLDDSIPRLTTFLQCAPNQPQAVSFYKHSGFRTIREEKDNGFSQLSAPCKTIVKRHIKGYPGFLYTLVLMVSFI